MSSPSDHEVKVGIWTGVADSYDAYRPRTPAALLNLLPQLAEVERPRLVVDLGSGSGLSTYSWAERAEQIIGVEPNDDMRRQAESKGAGQGVFGHISFRAGVSHNTGLPDACADIVTASQSLHWMEAQPTFAEVARILRPGGVFAAYDYDWPPLITPESDLLYDEFKAQLDPIFAKLPFDLGLGLGLGEHKGEHLSRMRQSGVFRLTREIGLHSEEYGDAERFVGLMLSNSGSILLQRGLVTEAQLNLDDFRARAHTLLGEAPRRWYFSYRVRLGVK
jgi:ubiquinone/menaquinone biosynthesis C-methylase UbiE